LVLWCGCMTQPRKKVFVEIYSFPGKALYTKLYKSYLT
jgi:hypothetical protein